MQQSLFPIKIDKVKGDIGGLGCQMSCSFIDNVQDAGELIFDFLSGKDQLERIMRAEEIWIKPNITSGSAPERGKTSQPAVLHHLIRILSFLDIPINKIKVADSSVIGVDTVEAAQVSGILPVCEEFGVEFMDLREIPFGVASIKNHRIFKKIPINIPFLNKNNYLINLAKIKSTYGSPVGFSIKNSKGVITDDYKLNFHLLGVQEAICDLYQAIDWNLTILEGFPVSELGKPSWSGLIAISNCSLFVDFCVAKICKVPTNDVPHLNLLASDYNLKITNPASIFEISKNVPSLCFSKVGLKDIEEEFQINVEGTHVCSGCRESFFRALTKIKKTGFVKSGTYLLGTCSHSEYPIIKGVRHIIGNCAIRSHDNFLLYCNDYTKEYLDDLSSEKIEGCPPTIDSMVARLHSEGRSQPVPFTMSPMIEDSFEIVPFQIALDAKQHHDIAHLLPKEDTDFSFLGLNVALGCEIICAAICHQINWNFLRKRILQATLNDPFIWAPNNLSRVTEQNIADILQGYEKAERIRAKERSQIIRELSKIFEENIDDFIGVFFENGVIRPDFLQILQRAPAFSADPHQKKLQVLIHSLANFSLVPQISLYSKPAIDYHIMRLYLRRGDVSSKNTAGKKYLEEEKSRRHGTILSLRFKVSEALEDISRLNKLPINVLNSIEWWIGRSVCTKDSPDCLLQGKLGDWLKSEYSNCPFIVTCFGYNCQKSLLRTREPLYKGVLF